MCDNLNSGIPPIVPSSFGHNTDPAFINRMMDALNIKNEAPFTGDMAGRGAMSLGRLANARVVGNEMVVDLVGTPKALAALMSSSDIGYNTVSPTVLRKEFVKDYFGENTDIVGPVVLGLALLGAEQPAYITQKGLVGLSNDILEQAGVEALEAYRGQPNDNQIAEGTALGGSTHIDGPSQGQEEEPEMPEHTNENETGTGFKPAEQDGQFSLQNLDANANKGMGIGHLQAAIDSMVAQLSAIQAGQEAMNQRIDGIVHEGFTAQLSAHTARWTFMDDNTRTAETERILELHKTAPEQAIAAMDAYDRVANMAASANATPPPTTNGNGQHPALRDHMLFQRQSAGIAHNGRELGTGESAKDMNDAIMEFAKANNLDPVLQYDLAVDQWCQQDPENLRMFEWMQGRGDAVITGDYTIIPN